MCALESYPGKEGELKEFVENELSEMLIFYDDDVKNNLFGERGKNPKVLLNAHFDSYGAENVGKNWMFEVVYDEKTDKIKGNGVRPVGADDRCGIAIILALLRFTDYSFKFLFTTYCEDEHQGIKFFIENHTEFFKGVNLVIGLDRRGFGDVVCSYGGKDICFKNECVDKVIEIGKSLGIPAKREKSPHVADIRFIADRFGISSFCLSVGYYNPHTTSEYAVLDEVVKTYEWMCKILESVQ
ncbi:peptidase M42 family protein [Caldicellulosiruptor owensensis OL]|uniref:Peptidase M42 family protein n=1 Tax=Caldicellulosiruptor owensensis (strain ATCC 700167 / DSM 13100 / OL) TaxID=632518 RepID=E4Q4G0_CALOW|nr:peptidase M42 [Caldicellulosiruptor owensensis]ADQ04122.1 peptidase M42 family protein [Caldicellulosiruptor owensensis OL]